MNRKKFIKKSFLLGTELYLFNSLLLGCSKKQNIEEYLNIDISKIKNTSNGQENPFYFYIEHEPNKIILFENEFTANSIYLGVQNKKIVKISITINEEDYNNLTTTLSKITNKQYKENITNPWGTESLIDLYEANFNVRLCNNKTTNYNQIIIESHQFKEYLL